MTQPPDAQITEPLARDIALRTGAVRVIFPTITGSHGSYNLHIDVQRPDSNGPSRYRNHWQQDFPWQSSSSTNSTTIPQELSSTLRDTNDWIRHLVGESKDDIARLDKPPEDVTTGDWRALADYSNAESLIVHGKRLEALAPLHSAVQRDPNFALAYARLGDILVNLSQISEGYTAYMKALSASEGNRLSLRQRDRIRGIYAQDTGDFQTSEEAFREYSTYYEKDYLGWFYRSRALLMLGRAREAEQSMRRAHDADKTRFGSVGALVRLELVLGDLNEAHHWTQELRNMGANEQAQYSDGIIHLVEGHYFAAGQSFRANLTSQSYRVSSLRLLADLAAEKGQYSDALSFLNQAISGNAEDARILIDRAYVYGKLGQISNCTDDVQSAIAKDSNPNQILSASQILGELLFVTPDPAIRRALNRLASEMPADNFGLISTIAHLRVEGEIQLAAGKTSEALTNFRKADKLEAPFESRDYLARALATAARYSTRSIESGQLRNEAMNLFGQIALHPESVWYFSENYPPGFYTDQLEHQIGLVNQLRPLTSEARSLRSRLLELRPNSKLANY
jgi:tetratricopeptide (TPR) repeat protein